MNETRKILASMLTQGTGRHLLDSGDHYGRHWEKNKELAGNDPVSYFDSLPVAGVKFSSHKNSPEIEITLNVFHFLADRLEYSPEMDDKFTEFTAESNEHDFADMEAFAEKFDSDKITVNTYNNEDLLSQVLQYVAFDSDFYDEETGEDLRGSFIALQIHQGCDVRGGYTSPRIFRAIDEGKYILMDNASASLYVENSLDTNQMTIPETEVTQDNSHGWTTDDGYNFYGNDCNQIELKDFETSSDKKDKGNGLIYIDEQGNGYSPINGKQIQIA
jgi:hypothetical protein